MCSSHGLLCSPLLGQLWAPCALWKCRVPRPLQVPFMLKQQKAVSSIKGIAVVHFPVGVKPFLLLEQEKELYFTAGAGFIV